MPMSRLPRSDWLGSRTSPPLITRSNLSAGPIAPPAGVVRACTTTPAAADPVNFRKLRRDIADMLMLPDVCFFDDAPCARFLQAAAKTAVALQGSPDANAVGPAINVILVLAAAGPKSPSGRCPWLPPRYSRLRLACSLPAPRWPMTLYRAASLKRSGYRAKGWPG